MCQDLTLTLFTLVRGIVLDVTEKVVFFFCSFSIIYIVLNQFSR